MTRHPIPRPALAMLSLLLSWSPLRAEEPALRELLRDALYTEEVARDSEKAAKQYEELLGRHDAQKTFAAAALFRLAEVRRKQDRKEDAIQLYQRLLAEFPHAETETKLAKENLLALGGKMPAANAANAVVQDAEVAELARLEGLAESAPDILLDPDTLLKAVENGQSKVVKYLLAKGSTPNEGNALVLAVERGNLEIVKLLTDGKASVPEKIASDALLAAIQHDRHTLLEFLLKKGLKPGMTASSYGQTPIFIQAVLNDKRKGAEILLQHGADVNVMVAAASGPRFKPCGTALHLILSTPGGGFDIASWLLEKGAKADLPDPHYGLTPLHYAAMNQSPGAAAMIGKLLAAGADPNRRSNGRMIKDDFLLNSTPLETAIAFPGEKLEKARLLLKHGAIFAQEGSKVAAALNTLISDLDSNASDLIEILGAAGFPMRDPELLTRAVTLATQTKDVRVLDRVLKYGADPNSKDTQGDSPLLQAAKSGDAVSLALLVKAGADIHDQSTDGKSALRLAASARNSNSGWDAIKVLLDAGAKPDEKWINEGFAGASTSIRHRLIGRFTIPSLANDSGIVLLVDRIDNLQTIRTSKPTGDAQAPSLARWLLDIQDKIENFPAGGKLKYHWALSRKNANGEMVKQDIDFNATTELPALKWGDVVTCLVEIPESSAYGFSNGFPGEFLWPLRNRVSFPITFEVQDKSREIIVRGDRIFFDPTKPEVPLANLQRVVEFLSMPTLHWETKPMIHVSRKGWPDIQLSYNSKEAAKFELEAGDQVMVETPDQTKEYRAEARRELVMLRVDDEGFPFVKFFGGTSEGEPVAARLPTLIQAIVDTQVPWTPIWMKMGGIQTVNVAELSEHEVFQRFALLPHLDLANIRIRSFSNVTENGITETVGFKNLAEIIAASTDQTTAEEARKADRILSPGDVVEIPLLKDRLGEPWKGFSAKEEAFFAKALSGRVRVTDDEGNISVRNLLYKAPRFIESANGWIPLPPESGIPTIRGSWLIPSGPIHVKRGDTQAGEQQASEIFLRDGDEIHFTKAKRVPQRPMSAQPPGVVSPPHPQVVAPRLPRPAIVPPPSPPSESRSR